MKRCAVLVSFVTLLAFVPKAHAEPGFCAAIGKNRVDWSGGLKDAIEDDDPRNALRNIVARMCKPDDESKEHMNELEDARKKWSARLELSDEDWADVADYAMLGQGERMNGEVRINTNGQEMGIGDTLKRTWSSFDPIDQFAMLRAQAGASGDLALDTNYLADALGAKLSETGRLAYIKRCISGTKVNGVQWAMCQADIDRFDPKKVGAELRANKVYSGADKIRVRIELDALKPMLAAHADAVKKLVASDPGYGKMFEIAAATSKEWESRKSDPLLDLAAEMDDARATKSRKAFAGCEDKTWAAWKSAMAAGVPAKKFEGMHDDRANGKSFVDTAMGPILGNQSVYLASVAMVTCMTVGQDRGTHQDILIRLLGDAMQRWPGYRGPRTSTETAIMTGGIVLDDRDAKLDFPSVDRPFQGGGGTRSGGGSGVIGALKPSGKTTNVTFKKQMVKQVQCAQARSTNRITQIRPDGSLIYESICVRNETVTVDKSDAPQNVNPRYLEGVKPGTFVSIIEDVVIAAWAKPGTATPTMVFGVALK